MTESSNSTELLIKEMKNAGEFERLATSILRVADPLYRGIVHTGVNPSGQTITDPLDGISICGTLNGPRFAVAFEHTISARVNLRDKWLNSNSGDLIKAIDKLKSFRDTNPDYEIKVVLTSSNTPSSGLVEDALSKAASDSIDLDIWSNDRLANILDVYPDGQYIRSKFFGRPQTTLSRDLAVEISRTQLKRFAPFDPTDQLILREVHTACPALESISSPVVFLSASSGSGKSVFCHQLCTTLVDDGGLAFILTHNALERCSSIGQAIRESLVGDAPSLILDNPVGDLIRISLGREVQIWIEDINLSASPLEMISKISHFASEMSEPKTPTPANRLQILCPVWPDNLRALPRDVYRASQNWTVDLSDFSDKEAREAIIKRFSAAGVNLTNVQADAVRMNIGNDPLLIGLLEGQVQGNEREVFSNFVDSALSKVGNSTSRSVFSLRCSVDSIASWMLESRINEPSFDGLHEKFGTTSVFSDMELICSDGRLFREIIQDRQSKLGFRHDRVRSFLLIEVISKALKGGDFSPDYLIDPYYSDLMSRASINHTTPETFWKFAKLRIPLVCFGALKYSQIGNPSKTTHLHKVCEEIVDSGLLDSIPIQIRWEIEWQIAGLEGPQFRELVEATDPYSNAGQEARVINGSVETAAELCYKLGPLGIAPFRDHLLAHIRKRHGVNWYRDLTTLINNLSQTAEQREGALILAGECSDTELAIAVAECWHLMQNRGDELFGGMLFAAVSCLSGVDNKTLDSVFRAWQALSNRDIEGKSDSGSSYKGFWLAKCLSGGLQRVKSERTLCPLIRFAESNTDMRHVVYDCLEQLDHSDAAIFVASHIAEIDKRCEGKDGGFNFVAESKIDRFGSRKNYNIRYSNSALRALQDVWEDKRNEHYFRKRCFQVWRSSVGLRRLQRLAENPPKGFEDEVLFTRCRLGDIAAVTELKAKINEGSSRSSYWFQLIRQFDSRLFDDLILQKLKENTDALKRGEKPDDFTGYIIANVLADRRDEFAEAAIVEHWDDLKNLNQFPYVLLCIATPATLRLHTRHFEGIKDKEEYFKFLGVAFGLQMSNRPGITDVTQLEALEPYLDYFEADLIEYLWIECNEKGFEDWRAEHLDTRLRMDSVAFMQINDEAAFRDLDVKLASRGIIAMEAYSWLSIHRHYSTSPRTLVARANRYVVSRASKVSVEFLVELLALTGERAELRLLRKHVDAGLLTQRDLDGIDFAVRKRSLI